MRANSTTTPPAIEPAATTVRDAVFAYLRTVGIAHVFGNPGSTELRFLRDWPTDFTYVTALHEGSAVAMADGYASRARNAAFVNLHSAGGLGNAMGSIFSAYRNQTPLVITAGQQTRSLMPDMPFLFAEDATTLPRPYVKWSCEPARGEDVPRAIARAYAIAMQRPFGPTFVSIPEDDWDRPASPVPAREIFGAFAASEEGIAAIVSAVASASKIAIVAGPGVDRDDACGALVAFAEHLDVPVWVSPFSSRCSFPERHANFAGFLPPVKTGIARALAPYDLVLVLGAPIFTYHVETGGEPFAPGTRVVQVVDDPATAAAAPVGTCVVATLARTIRRLTDATTARSGTGEKLRNRTIRASVPSTPNERATPAAVLGSIARALPPGAIVVEEAPTHRGAMHEHLPIAEAGAFYAAASGSLGWALPAAIGVALAAPTRRVVALLGDGSSTYAIQALWTAARLHVPVTFVVLNNGSYAAMDEFGRFLGFEGTPSFDLAGLDFVRAAEAFGVRGVRVATLSHFDECLRVALAATEPTLVEVSVEASTGEIYERASPGICGIDGA
jgi:benzoylformate decarboxylase